MHARARAWVACMHTCASAQAWLHSRRKRISAFATCNDFHYRLARMRQGMSRSSIAQCSSAASRSSSSFSHCKQKQEQQKSLGGAKCGKRRRTHHVWVGLGGQDYGIRAAARRQTVDQPPQLRLVHLCSSAHISRRCKWHAPIGCHCYPVSLLSRVTSITCQWYHLSLVSRVIGITCHWYGVLRLSAGIAILSSHVIATCNTWSTFAPPRPAYASG
jgi:hypothetical protein